MIELIDSLIHMVVLAICTLIALYHAYHSRAFARRVWILYALFTGEYFMGDLFSTLYLAFYDETPWFYVSDLSWYTAYLFLSILLIYISERESIRMVTWAQLFIPLFTISSGVFFVIEKGDLFGNIVGVVVMTSAMWLAGGGLEMERQKAKEWRREKREEGGERRRLSYVPDKRPLFFFSLALLGLEYAFWFTSSFWIGDTLMNPYFWVDVLFMISTVCLIPAIKKALAVPGDEA